MECRQFRAERFRLFLPPFDQFFYTCQFTTKSIDVFRLGGTVRFGFFKKSCELLDLLEPRLAVFIGFAQTFAQFLDLLQPGSAVGF